MMRKMILFLVLVIFAWSCKEDEEFDVTVRDSGNLRVHFADKDGTPVTDGVVKLYPADLENDFDDVPLLDVQSINEEGLVDFGELKSGSYYAMWELTSGNLKYKTYDHLMAVQVVAGVDRDLDVNINSRLYNGTLNLTVRSDDFIADIIADAKILVVQRVNGSTTKDFSELLERGIKGVSDVDGKLLVENLPGGYSYDIYYYNDNGDSEYLNSYFLYPDYITYKTVYVDSI
ncbi:hypothetical protein [Fulvivirga ligni]|uniref:hypothetical protein n=1 Tax=Fulvivirga ligni TaxID=2904246 RepID=UPI001F3680B6|nr:hypothetical protein [Fulvivirga ligni]UII20131.1 hypothetical protein LVD16_19995 [Fulvivirga ligni]